MAGFGFGRGLSRHGGNKLDPIPDAFSFVDQSNVNRSTLTESNAITVAGIVGASPITVTGGEYQKNGGSWTSSAGTVINGDAIKVRGTSSGSFSTAVNVVLSIGGISDTFTITTLAQDITPDAFSFTDVTGATTATVYTSNDFTVAGINDAAAVSITGGQYQVNGGSWVSTAGSVVNGDSVKVRGTSASAFATAVNVALTIGGVSDTYTITTEDLVNTVAPAITGDAWVGETLTSSTGTWTNSPGSYAYRWTRDGVDIGGATSSTYVLVVADKWAAIRCRVTPTKSGVSASPATSAATSAVEYVPVLLGFHGADLGSVFTNDSPQAIAITRSGTGAFTSYATPKFGSGCLFTASANGTDRVLVGSASDMNIAANEDFTIESWVRFTTAFNATLRKAIWGRNLASGDYTVDIGPSGSAFPKFAAFGGSSIESSTQLTLGSFQHLAVAREGDTLRMFLDGALVASATGWASWASALAGPFGINGNGATNSQGEQSQDEFRFTRGKARYTAAFTPTTSRFPRRTSNPIALSGTYLGSGSVINSAAATDSITSFPIGTSGVARRVVVMVCKPVGAQLLSSSALWPGADSGRAIAGTVTKIYDNTGAFQMFSIVFDVPDADTTATLRLTWSNTNARDVAAFGYLVAGTMQSKTPYVPISAGGTGTSGSLAVNSEKGGFVAAICLVAAGASINQTFSGVTKNGQILLTTTGNNLVCAGAADMAADGSLTVTGAWTGSNGWRNVAAVFR